MSLIQKLAPLVEAGVVVHLTLRKAGDKVQLELLPEADTKKTGICIPPRAFTGTPVELDEGMEEFLPNYVRSATDLNQQIAETAAVMAKAEADAKTARQSAAKPRVVEPAGKAGSSSSSGRPSTKKDDPAAGFLDEDDDETGGTGGCGSEACSASSDSGAGGVTSGGGVATDAQAGADESGAPQAAGNIFL